MPTEDPMAWQRDDIRQSFLAPQICLHQALTVSGYTASGVGETPAEARQAALGETAEMAALGMADAHRLPRRFQPTRDGIAADASRHVARERALLEASERRGVTDWWLGTGRAAQPLSDLWLASTGLASWIAKMRQGADLRRTTALWRLEPDTVDALPVRVVVARSLGSTGQSPMVGYGCGATTICAAQKAVRELLLMEIRVMDEYVQRAFGSPVADTAARRQIADFAARLPDLLPDGPAITPCAEVAAEPIYDDVPLRALTDWLSGPVVFSDLPAPTAALNVMLCQPLGAKPVLMPGAGSPFVGETGTSEGIP